MQIHYLRRFAAVGLIERYNESVSLIRIYERMHSYLFLPSQCLSTYSTPTSRSLILINVQVSFFSFFVTAPLCFYAASVFVLVSVAFCPTGLIATVHAPISASVSHVFCFGCEPTRW